MSTVEDTDKFMELAGTNVPPPPDADDILERNNPDPYDWDETQRHTKRKQSGGSDCQYAFNGPGFVPVSKTAARLSAGVYSITSINNQWTFIPHDIVTDNLLNLPDSKSEFVIKEIERFWTLKQAFKDFGYTHKRGFLLWGPPGSGKTATVAMVIKNMVNRDGVVFLADMPPAVVTSMLRRFRSIEPERPALVILEDIDAYVREHGESNVLSILDGESSIANVVYIATTNYPEHLDPRVINRPSRFDLLMFIDMPNAASRKLYLESRKTGLSPADIDRWVKDTDGFSIAHLKEVIVGVCLFGKPVNDEIKRLRSMMKTRVSSEDTRGSVGFGNG
jgi:AAA+ superfamily predicted ATPase